MTSIQVPKDIKEQVQAFSVALAWENNQQKEQMKIINTCNVNPFYVQVEVEGVEKKLLGIDICPKCLSERVLLGFYDISECIYERTVLTCPSCGSRFQIVDFSFNKNNDTSTTIQFVEV